jgi:hypothetical protein
MMKTRIIDLLFGSRLLSGSLAMLIMLSLAGAAQAQEGYRIWTSVASTGTVDETDAGEIAFSGPFAEFSGTAGPAARATIRYNVVAVDGLFAQAGPQSWPALIVNYRDNGPDARVQAFLREYDFLTAQVHPTKRILFDSDLYAPSNNYQTRAVGNCGLFDDFDFVPNNQTVHAYFIEVLLYRASSSGTPGLGGLAISRYGVCLNIAFQQP